MVTRNSLFSINSHSQYREFIVVLSQTLSLDASMRISAKKFLNTSCIKQGIYSEAVEISEVNKKVRRFRRLNLIQQISFMYAAKFLIEIEQICLLTSSYIKYCYLVEEESKVSSSEPRKHNKLLNVNYTEFLAAHCKWKSILNTEMMDQMYLSMNTTGEGIQPLHLQKYLKNKNSWDIILQAFKQLNTESSSIQEYTISKAEYINILIEGL